MIGAMRVRPAKTKPGSTRINPTVRTYRRKVLKHRARDMYWGR